MLRHISKLSKINIVRPSVTERFVNQEKTEKELRYDKGTIEAATLNAEHERSKTLKIFKLELELAAQESRHVPPVESVTEKQWEAILTKKSISGRFKFYRYLYKTYHKIQAAKQKKIAKAAEIAMHREQELKSNAENEHIIYGLHYVSFFMRIYDTTMDRFANKRLINAMQFAPKLVIDCSYDEHMTERESINAAKQMMYGFTENRNNAQPFDLHLCNARKNTKCVVELNKFMPTVYKPEFPLHVHEESFTDVFPKQNLVYLTPHCNEILDKYNPDDIYVIGAMVDKHGSEPLSLAKAKRLGLRMAKLPLDLYLQWGRGSGKSLTINQMVMIMLDVKNTGDWNHALRHVPRRKVVIPEREAAREMKLLNFTKRQQESIRELLKSHEDIKSKEQLHPRMEVQLNK